MKEIAKAKNDFIYWDTENPRLKGIQAYLREVSKLKFDETPNYVKLSKLLSDLDSGVRFYLAELKKMFMKAAKKVII